MVSLLLLPGHFFTSLPPEEELGFKRAQFHIVNLVPVPLSKPMAITVPPFVDISIYMLGATGFPE